MKQQRTRWTMHEPIGEVFCPECGIDINIRLWMEPEDVLPAIDLEAETWVCQWRVLGGQIADLGGLVGVLISKAIRRVARLEKG